MSGSPPVKTLLLVRHAKSSWGDAGLPDIQRPLNERGLHDAPMMGDRLARRGVQPERWLTSPAVRARTTAEILGRKLGRARADIDVDDRLYGATLNTLLDVIHALDDKLQVAMLVGHNPGLSELAHRLSTPITHLPTCAVAEFAFDVDSWSRVGQVGPVRATLESPKSA